MKSLTKTRYHILLSCLLAGYVLLVCSGCASETLPPARSGVVLWGEDLICVIVDGRLPSGMSTLDVCRLQSGVGATTYAVYAGEPGEFLEALRQVRENGTKIRYALVPRFLLTGRCDDARASHGHSELGRFLLLSKVSAEEVGGLYLIVVTGTDTAAMERADTRLRNGQCVDDTKAYFERGLRLTKDAFKALGFPWREP